MDEINKDEILCTYHLKTVMLWTCEERSSEWFNSSSIIEICCELLRKLSEWLENRYCPNYFITEANLYYEPSSSETIKLLEWTVRQLNKFRNSEILCHWFVDNYILPSIRGRLTITGPIPHFVDCMLHLIEFWKVIQFESLDFYFYQSFAIANARCRSIIKQRYITGLRTSLKMAYANRNEKFILNIRLRNLPVTQDVSCFMYYDILLHILQAAYGLGCGEISWDSSLVVEFVTAVSMKSSIIRSEYHNYPKTYTEQSRRFQFLRAQDLMKNITGLNSRSEFQLLYLMSKTSFREALKYEDSQVNGIAPAALAYLAALHFATSEYQEAKRFCLAVFQNQTSQEHKETLNAACLLFVEGIAQIVGLSVLQKKITESNNHYINTRLYLDLRLSPQVFAYYLTGGLLLAQETYSCLDWPHDLPDLVCSMDEYLKALIL